MARNSDFFNLVPTTESAKYFRSLLKFEHDYPFTVSSTRAIVKVQWVDGPAASMISRQGEQFTRSANTEERQFAARAIEVRRQVSAKFMDRVAEIVCGYFNEQVISFDEGLNDYIWTDEQASIKHMGMSLSQACHIMAVFLNDQMHLDIEAQQMPAWVKEAQQKHFNPILPPTPSHPAGVNPFKRDRLPASTFLHTGEPFSYIRRPEDAQLAAQVEESLRNSKAPRASIEQDEYTHHNRPQHPDEEGFVRSDEEARRQANEEYVQRNTPCNPPASIPALIEALIISAQNTYPDRLSIIEAHARHLSRLIQEGVNVS